MTDPKHRPDTTGHLFQILLEAQKELSTSHLDLAKKHCTELLEAAEEVKNDLNFGNILHQAYRILGLIALESDNITEAKNCLILSGNVPSTLQLRTFGPNMQLAQELLNIGERDCVLEYLEQCAEFWKEGHIKLSRWTSAIQSDHSPDFGPNLVYGTSWPDTQ